MLDHLRVGERGQQFDCGRSQAFQRILGGRLVETDIFQRAADQDMAVATGNRIAPLGQHHARQEVLRAFEENHLSLHRLDRDLQSQSRQQLSAPGTRRHHDLLGTHIALRRPHAHDPRAILQEALDRAMLDDRHVGQPCQRRAQRLQQSRIANVGHALHVDGPFVTLTQRRHGLAHRLHRYRVQRTAITLGPTQRLGLVVQVEPVEACHMHLGVHPRLAQQACTQLRIEILRPMRQRSHRWAVAPRIKRRNDPAAGPGGFAADIARLQQQHRLPRFRHSIGR